MISSIFSSIAALQTEGFQDQQGNLTDVLAIVAATFALLLFALSVIAWSRRRQTSLILVSAVFIVFFIRIVLEILPNEGNVLQFISVLLDFVILTLFFFAIVVNPRTRGRTQQQAAERDPGSQSSGK